MGEIADMMLEGILCEACGEFIDENGAVAPRKCQNCGGLSRKTIRSIKRIAGRTAAARKNSRHNIEQHLAAMKRKPFKCHCGKLCHTAKGLESHQYAKHGSGGW